MAEETKGEVSGSAESGMALDALRKEHDLLRASHEATQAELQTSKKRYDDDMRAVADFLSRSAATPPAAAVAASEEDPESAATKGDVRRDVAAAVQASQQELARGVAGEILTLAKATRAANRQLARVDGSFRFFDRFAGEIDQRLDLLDPRLAAQPDAYRRAYQLVAGEHLDEITNLIRDEALKASGEDEESDEEESSASSGAPGGPSTRAAEKGGGGKPLPPADASPRGRRVRAPALSEDERFTVERYFKGDAAAYEKAKGAEIDWLDSKGRDRF